MKSVADITIGFRDAEIDNVRDSLERSLAHPLEMRYSTFYGGDYYFCEIENEEIRLYRNQLIAGGLEIEDRPDIKILLEVSETGRADFFKRLFCDSDIVWLQEVHYDVHD